MSSGIAIVGIGCRFPGAESAQEYWENLLGGVESIQDFSEAELRESGVDPEDLCSPSYIRRAPVLKDIASFDARLFGFSREEACITDPQQRIFLEVCRDALDDSGLTMIARACRTGVFATSGGSVSSYLVAAVSALKDRYPLATGGKVHLGNDKDFLATRVSYKLDLRGPSLNVQTACSSSLVALDLACQSLRHGESDIAIAGASCVRVPQVSGYRADLDPILSKDGRCRPFDANATGTLFGSGAGAVVLKRYEDALRDCDNIYAVIVSTSMNNDGGQKVSYTASSVPAQKACIEAALSKAEVVAEQVGYVECHGTATKIGDPLEIKALGQAFKVTSSRSTYCAIGSVKGNIGHLEQAAGIASLIKTTLMLKHRMIVPSLHCENVNPKLKLADSPFYVAGKSTHWSSSSSGGHRFAGINCLGMGGTNVFAVLRDHTPPATSGTAASRSSKRSLLCLSAKTSGALRESAKRYMALLRSSPDTCLEQITYTANTSRTEFGHRLSWVGHTREELAERLERHIAMESDTSGESAVFVYACRLEQWHDAHKLATAVLKSVPEEVGRDYAAFTRMMDALARGHESPTQSEIVQLLKQEVFAVVRCEYLMHAVARYYGAVSQRYHGMGLGYEVGRCLENPQLWSAFVSSTGAQLARWAAELPPAALQRGGRELYQEFSLHVLSHSSAVADCMADTRHCLLQTRACESFTGTAVTFGDFVHEEGYDLAALIGALYVAGADIRWSRYYQAQVVPRVSLPSYPYQRSRYWFTDLPRGER